MKAAENKASATTAATTIPFFNKGSGQHFFSGPSNDSPFFTAKHTTPTAIQTKLAIGQPNNKYEQEADAIADKVVQRLATPDVQTKKETAIQAKPLVNKITPLVQAKCATCEQEDKLQKKEEDLVQESPMELQLKPIFESNAEPPDDENAVQRKCAECAKEDKLQKKSDSPDSSSASSSIESSLNSSKGGGSPIPADTKEQMESSFGADFSNVRLHTDSSAVQMNKDLHAQAFTHGDDIYFNSGKYDTNNTGGKHLLAHELTHVIQQNQYSINTRIQMTLAGQKECASYERGEIEKSHTGKGHLSNDVFFAATIPGITKQGLIIADYGVDWGSVRDSTKADGVLQFWLQKFENDPGYQLEITGFSDCTGIENQNQTLRKRRATKVFQLLDKARSKVLSQKAAPMNDFIVDNGTAINRAINRGVLIQFSQNLSYSGDLIEVQPPPPPPVLVPADTTDCDKTQAEALTRALALAKDMVVAALGVIDNPGQIDNIILLRTYFGTDVIAHRYHIRHHFMQILDGLKDGPTFQCEESGSWWCDGAVARVIPIIGENIHICPEAIANGDDYLARTIVHEAGHGYAWIFIPDDLCAGGWSGDTTDAEDNADCYGEFAGEAHKI